MCWIMKRNLVLERKQNSSIMLFSILMYLNKDQSHTLNTEPRLNKERIDSMSI